MLSMNIGVMIGYALSSAFHYKTIGFICIGLPIISLILSFCILHETPQQIINGKKEEDAKKSLRFYRNCTQSTSIKELQEFDEEFEIMKNEIIESKGKDEKITLSDFSECTQKTQKFENIL